MEHTAALCVQCERKEGRIEELEQEVEYLEDELRQEKDAREEAEADRADLEAQMVENVADLRTWLDRRTGELKWHESHGGESEHLRDLMMVLALLNGAVAEVLPV